jgi:hypothetical protein
MAKLLQFTSEFLVVVNFAIEYDGYIAVFGQNGLVAAVEVDDPQPRGAHGAEARLKDTLLVRSAMSQCGRGAGNASRIRHPTFVCESNDATQGRAPLSLSQNQLCDSHKSARGRLVAPHNQGMMGTSKTVSSPPRLFQLSTMTVIQTRPTPLGQLTLPPTHNHHGDADTNQKHAPPPPGRDLFPEKEFPSQSPGSVAHRGDRDHQTNVFPR